MQNVFFVRLLQGKSHCISELKAPNQIVGAKPLPINVLLQMDNCVKDNKNRYLLAFLSLLIAREVFEEVKLGFLVVGHTHEDIDNCFGYLSIFLKKQNNYYFGKFNEGFHGLTRVTFHSKVDPRDSIF